MNTTYYKEESDAEGETVLTDYYVVIENGPVFTIAQTITGIVNDVQRTYHRTLEHAIMDSNVVEIPESEVPLEIREKFEETLLQH